MTPHYGTYKEFVEAVEELLAPTAAAKGYATTGVDGINPLYEFVAGVAGGPGHALGEIVYKATRYAAKRNPEDLLKISAWAFLAWRHHGRPGVSMPSTHPANVSMKPPIFDMASKPYSDEDTRCD